MRMYLNMYIHRLLDDAPRAAPDGSSNRELQTKQFGYAPIIMCKIKNWCTSRKQFETSYLFLSASKNRREVGTVSIRFVLQAILVYHEMGIKLTNMKPKTCCESFSSSLFLCLEDDSEESET
mmetsp:Transcript_40129/g.59012  ORF Transcript_40129/g.59012 Transcript_40129/m.59012 type:complete len:122 (-) Transcript_40129:832-1197(-)